MNLIYKIILYVVIGIILLSISSTAISKQPQSFFYNEGFIGWTPEEKEEISINNGIFLSVLDFEIEKVPVRVNTKRSIDNIENSEAYKTVVLYSKKYGVDLKLSLNIAYCESGFNQFAVSSTGCTGIYQFNKGTWLSVNNKMNRLVDIEDRFDLEKNIEAAIWKLAHEGDGAWRPWSGGCYLNNPLNI